MNLPEPEKFPGVSLNVDHTDGQGMKISYEGHRYGISLTEEQKIYSYRQLRGHHVIENVFGNLT